MSDTPYRPFVVGFRGLAGAGKSTIACIVCNIICKDYDAEDYAEIIPMAGALKAGLATMGITKDVTPALYRKAATVLGTDVVRLERPEHWVQLFERTIANRTPGHTPPIVLVDDIRFPNEAKCCDLIFFVASCGFSAQGVHHQSELWNSKFGWDLSHFGLTVPLQPNTYLHQSPHANLKDAIVVYNVKDEQADVAAEIAKKIMEVFSCRRK